MISYTLLKNRLSTALSAPYIPKTLLEGNLSFEQLIKALAYGSTATSADVKAVLDNIERVCIENLSQGRSVSLGFCTLRPQVKGKFLSPIDSFTPENNWIEVSISANSMFQKKVTLEAKLERVAVNKTLPVLLALKNHTSGVVTNVSANDNLSIHGENLKFEKGDSNQGVFFVSAGSEVRASEYPKISAKEILVKVPTGLLVVGENYKLKVKGIFGQEIRVGELDHEVTAA